jgi:hypothetical protein
MSGSGKGGDSRKNKKKSFRRTDRGKTQNREEKQSKKNVVSLFASEGKIERNRGSMADRPRWTPPALSTGPIPAPECPWCGRPIKDLAAAIAGDDSGEPVHFDCVIARISQTEELGSGDSISYIGGGRFAVIHFNNPPDMRDFKIKKILEWEKKDEHSSWRQNISGHFSVT